MQVQSWRPKKRNIKIYERPEWVPEYIYNEALAAKKFYNEQWEFWVYEESLKANVSVAIAEDACIRGLKTALDRIDFVHGPKIADWYRQFLDMKDIFTKVKHPEYTEVKLG